MLPHLASLDSLLKFCRDASPCSCSFLGFDFCIPYTFAIPVHVAYRQHAFLIQFSST